MADLKNKLILSVIFSLPILVKSEIVSNNSPVGVRADVKASDDAYKILLNEAGQPVFNSKFLHGVSSGVNEVVNFDAISNVLPGRYNVDVVLNGDGLSSIYFDFKKVNNKVIPCFTDDFIAALNVDFSLLPEDSSKSLERIKSGECVPVGEIIPDSTAIFDVGTLGLEVTIPQAFLEKVPRGYINPEFWDKGINAAMLRYRLNQYKTSGQFSSDSSFASIEAGFNYDGWNIRHDGYWSRLAGVGFATSSTYDSINTYVERAIPSIKSKVYIGDSYTDGAVYESIGIRGVQLVSSDLMTPVSMRGYSPVVRGFASSNAKVSIRQNGVLIYETTVAPGPFAIDDLYAAGNNANLDVTVTEADGSQSYFIVPSSASPQLVREKQYRYSAAAGQFRRSGSTTNFNLSRFSAQYGVSNRFTAYGGATLGNDYYSILFGGAYSTPYGSFSGDVDTASIDLNGAYGRQSDVGHRVRLGYSHFIKDTQSSLNASIYSFARDYWSVDTFSNYRDSWFIYSPEFIPREKQRFQLAYNQNVKNIGSFYALVSRSTYWNDADVMITGQLGYAKSFRIKNYSFGMSVNYSREKILKSNVPEANRVAVTFTFPLGTDRPSTLSTSMVRDKNQGNSQQVRASGVATKDNKLSYGVSANHQANGGNDAGVNLQYRASSASLETTASRSAGNSQYSASISGGVVLHAGGMTLANEIGDTIGLIYAPGAQGAKLKRELGIEVDSRGYAIVPYLDAYQRNNVVIDTTNVSADVSFESVSEQVVPYENAVVLLKFETMIGKVAIFDIDRSDGTPPPFGSVIKFKDGKEIGLVGQGGNSFVSGLQDKGEFFVKWGDQSGQTCKVEYDFNEYESTDSYISHDVKCYPLSLDK